MILVTAKTRTDCHRERNIFASPGPDVRLRSRCGHGRTMNQLLVKRINVFASPSVGLSTSRERS